MWNPAFHRRVHKTPHENEKERKKFQCMSLDVKYMALYLYRVRIKSFPDYEHLLQENYCTWNTNTFLNIIQEVFATH